MYRRRNVVRLIAEGLGSSQHLKVQYRNRNLENLEI